MKPNSVEVSPILVGFQSGIFPSGIGKFSQQLLLGKSQQIMRNNDGKLWKNYGKIRQKLGKSHALAKFPMGISGSCWGFLG